MASWTLKAGWVEIALSGVINETVSYAVYLVAMLVDCLLDQLDFIRRDNVFAIGAGIGLHDQRGGIIQITDFAPIKK